MQIFFGVENLSIYFIQIVGFHERVINPAVTVLEILGKVNKTQAVMAIPKFFMENGEYVPSFLAAPIGQSLKNSFIHCQKLLQITKDNAKSCQRKGRTCG